jgi:deferrochelatase/peroxidase EfeB
MALDIDLISGPIDPTNSQYVPLLAHLQGNILKSHGRDHTVNLFLTFQAGKKEAVERWIGFFSRRYVTSALRQYHESLEFKTNRLSGRIFGSLSLSASGYEYLEKDLAAFVERRNPKLTSNVRFTAGIKAAREELQDPDPEQWELNSGGQQIHALVLLADEDRKRLKDVLAIVLKDLKARNILEQWDQVEGLALRDEHNQPLEHFGYRDGVSQPLFFTGEVTEERERFGTSDWDPSASLSLALVPDPFAPSPLSFGSYLVFRKLEQDVLGFKRKEAELASRLAAAATANGLPKFNEERAGALAVGRFENGVPIVSAGSQQAEQFRDFNDFNYHDDQRVTPGGPNPVIEPLRCPFQGHIRKTNPRGDTRRVTLPALGLPIPEEVDEEERGRRITRRGITFGERTLNKEGQLEPPELQEDQTLNPPVQGPVGLLFQCYQASIPDQFGFMQVSWANNPNFPAPGVGIDPIIGQGNPDNPAQKWPPAYDSPDNAEALPFGGFVTMKGGEFFFTPSIPFLLLFGEDNPTVEADAAENERRTLPNKMAK